MTSCVVCNKDILSFFTKSVAKTWNVSSTQLLPWIWPVQFSSVAQLCSTLCDPMDYSMPGFPVQHHLPELAQTHVHWVGDDIEPSHPPAFSLSQHQPLGSFPMSRWPRYWSFSFSISPSNEYSVLISFRIDWLDRLTVQGTFKSLQHHSSKASILQRSAFFTDQLSHPYMYLLPAP